MNGVKARYFAASCLGWLSPRTRACPSCGCRLYETVDRKYLVTTLRRCRDCQLMYRAPPDDTVTNQRFYQQEYREGFTTEMPDRLQLQELLANGFAGSAKNYDYYITVLKTLGLQP